MTEKILNILKENGVKIAAPIALSNCDIVREHKLKRVGFNEYDSLFAVIIAVPYLTPQKSRNISAYAVPRDYHLYFKELFSSIIPILEATFPGKHFVGFADDSPINERDAAAKAGMGIIGDNGMLITEKYSSYVFLGEIITDLPLECEIKPIKHCQGCGKCKEVCPISECGQCLSALTQKKGELTVEEMAIIKKYGYAWGCDKCQEVCPHTLRAIKNATIYTDIDFFKKDTIPTLSSAILDAMSDEDFEKRAYSWRKRETVKRNLDLLDS